jgi:hypothetical protein
VAGLRRTGSLDAFVTPAVHLSEALRAAFGGESGGPGRLRGAYGDAAWAGWAARANTTRTPDSALTGDSAL